MEAVPGLYGAGKGCMWIRLYGFALWEGIQKYLDALTKKGGIRNAYFPLFLPESFLNREKEHVKGFAPEVAVVTYAGGEELKEKMEVLENEIKRMVVSSYYELINLSKAASI